MGALRPGLHCSRVSTSSVGSIRIEDWNKAGLNDNLLPLNSLQLSKSTWQAYTQVFRTWMSFTGSHLRRDFGKILPMSYASL